MDMVRVIVSDRVRVKVSDMVRDIIRYMLSIWLGIVLVVC